VFVVTGNFRSRTKWASVFLSTPECPVMHDSEDVTGVVSTPLVLKRWRDIPDETKIALIYRPSEDVINAMQPYGISEATIRAVESWMGEMMNHREVEVFDFYTLDPRRLWEYCHGTPVSDEYISVFEDMNITQHSMKKLRRAS